jgi:hypothetical protein
VIIATVVPFILMAGFALHVFSTPAGTWLFFIWPSSIMLMATENLGHSPQALAILGLSIAWNVLSYLLLFTFVWSVGWVLRAWRGSLRDGTTI